MTYHGQCCSVAGKSAVCVCVSVPGVPVHTVSCNWLAPLLRPPALVRCGRSRLSPIKRDVLPSYAYGPKSPAIDSYPRQRSRLVIGVVALSLLGIGALASGAFSSEGAAAAGITANGNVDFSTEGHSNSNPVIVLSTGKGTAVFAPCVARPSSVTSHLT